MTDKIDAAAEKIAVALLRDGLYLKAFNGNDDLLRIWSQQEAAIAIADILRAELSPDAGEWVSVEERLPEPGFCLAWCSDRIFRVVGLDPTSDTFIGCENGCHVTHWMRISPPPPAPLTAEERIEKAIYTLTESGMAHRDRDRITEAAAILRGD